MEKISRRDVIIRGLKLACAGIAAHTFFSKKLFAGSGLTAEDKTVTVIKGDDLSKGTVEKMAARGFDEIGGIGRFIKSGMKVVIKPNIGWNSTPELAHTTNPDLVEAVARLCVNAGASVKIFDRPVHTAQLAYRRSGMNAAADNAGAAIEFVDERKFKTVQVKGGLNLTSLEVYADIINADFIINMPIAKHHSASTLTMAMKNLMGVIGLNRGGYHGKMHENIVDFNKAIPVNLVILDALRILTDHGPASGTLRDILETRTVIFGTNPVTVDAYTVGLFRQTEKHRNITPEKLGYLKMAAAEGMGEINVRNMNIREFRV